MPEHSGRRGEDYTVRLLEQRGARILRRNYHSRYGEVDIIAQMGEELLFVEVKTRKIGAMVSGYEAITRQKQRRIITTALLYLQEHEPDLQPRFDVCVVETRDGEIIGHDYLEAAFDGGAYESD